MNFLPESYREIIRQAYAGYCSSVADMDSFGKMYAWFPPDFDVDRVNMELSIIAGCVSSAISMSESGHISSDEEVREFVI